METREALRQFLTHPGNGMNTPKTRQARRDTVRRLDQNRDVNTWTQQEIVDWLVSLNISDVTRRRYRNDLRAFFSWAHWQGLIDQDPTVHLKREITLNPQPTREHNWLTRQEVDKIIAACDPSTLVGRRDEVLFRLGFTTGLRPSEIASIRWKHVDLDNKSIWLEAGKGGKPGTLTITARTHPVLADWRATCAAHIGWPPRDEAVLPCMSARIVEGDVVIPQPVWDKPLTYRGLLVRTKEHSARCGIEFRPHDMRRTFSGLMEEAGAPVADIKRALRHSTIAVTETYLQRRLDDAKRAQDYYGVDFA